MSSAPLEYNYMQAERQRRFREIGPAPDRSRDVENSSGVDMRVGDPKCLSWKFAIQGVSYKWKESIPT